MPIVRYNIEPGATQADGGKQVIVRYFDQDSIEYTEGFYAGPQYNSEARAAARAVELSEQLALTEFNSLVGL